MDISGKLLCGCPELRAHGCPKPELLTLHTINTMPKPIKKAVIQTINVTRQGQGGTKWLPNTETVICNVHYIDHKGPSRANKDLVPVNFKRPNPCSTLPTSKRTRPTLPTSKRTRSSVSTRSVTAISGGTTTVDVQGLTNGQHNAQSTSEMCIEGAHHDLSGEINDEPCDENLVEPISDDQIGLHSANSDITPEPDSETSQSCCHTSLDVLCTVARCTQLE